MAPGRIDPEPAVSSRSLQSLQSVTSEYDCVLRFYLNGTQVVLDESIDPEITLLEYLRGIGLTGTKLGCAEGGKQPLQKDAGTLLTVFQAVELAPWYVIVPP